MTEEQRNKRIEYHLYKSNEGITEHVERIVSLEELCQDLYQRLKVASDATDNAWIDARLEERVKSLGVEV